MSWSFWFVEEGAFARTFSGGRSELVAPMLGLISEFDDDDGEEDEVDGFDEAMVHRVFSEGLDFATADADEARELDALVHLSLSSEGRQALQFPRSQGAVSAIEAECAKYAAPDSPWQWLTSGRRWRSQTGCARSLGVIIFAPPEIERFVHDLAVLADDPRVDAELRDYLREQVAPELEGVPSGCELIGRSS